jgi:FdhD protein
MSAAIAGAAIQQLAVQRWRDGRAEHVLDSVAEEVPVALSYNTVAHVVMLATPRDLADLGVGFSLSESLVHERAELRDLQVARTEGGFEVNLTISQPRFAAMLQRRRNLTGRTGCGVCGAETIADAIRPARAVAAGGSVSRHALASALDALPAQQPLGEQTGSLHAAAFVAWDGGITVAREDVGRHNALDKVIGALALGGGEFDAGFALVTSRASYELVQKCATLGIRMLVAVSAPTALAVRMAEQTGMTLVGFARGASLVVYANPQRLR